MKELLMCRSGLTIFLPSKSDIAGGCCHPHGSKHASMWENLSPPSPSSPMRARSSTFQGFLSLNENQIPEDGALLGGMRIQTEIEFLSMF
jgi:hypothetical protein